MNAFPLPALALLGLAACASFTTDQNRKAAETFYENAMVYYRGHDYARAADQTERGLQLDPRSYRLNLLKGQVLLQQARTDPELYKQAVSVLEEVKGMRAWGDLDYEVILHLGQAHQGLYQYHRRTVKRLEKEAETRGVSESRKRELVAQAGENHRLYLEHMAAAAREYESLVETEDLGAFPARERLFILETDKALDLEGEARARQLAVAAAQAEKYLELNTYRQKHYEKMVELTGDLAQETEGKRALRELRHREQGFRATYARLLFEMHDYAKAKVQLDHVLESDPTRAPDYFNRARCLVELKQPAEAQQDLQNFLRLTRQPFDSEEVREANRLLAEIAKK